METIKVLGSGCAKCVSAAKRIESVAEACGVDVTVVKETSPEIIMGYGVMSTPAVVVNDQVVHAGSVPEVAVIAQWLKAL